MSFLSLRDNLKAHQTGKVYLYKHGHFDISKGTYPICLGKRLRLYKVWFNEKTFINMLIFAKIQFTLLSLTQLVVRANFSQAEQLCTKFQILINGKCLRIHGKNTFFATNVENVKNSGFK